MGSSQSTGKDQTAAGFTQQAQKFATAAGQLPQHAQTLATGLNQAAASTAALGQAGQNFVAQNKAIYQMAMAHMSRQQGVVGGGAFTGGFFGGDATEDPAKALKEYRDSLSAATKDNLIRGLARALKRAGIDVDENGSAEEIVQSLTRALPHPKKGKSFGADAKTQETVCKTIADVINDEFSPGARKEDRLIDTSLGAVAVCRQVSDLVHSMATGLHTEFLEVHASLTRVLRNLEVLDEVLKQSHNEMLGQLEGAQLKTGADKKLEDYEELYRRAQRERERQMLMLRNFLSVTLAPAKEELALAMQTEGEEHALIASLELVPGTGKFADTLAAAISGLGTIAAVSARVDKALRAANVSVAEYLASPDMEELEKSLDAKLTSGAVSADKLASFLKAVQVLKENFYRREELDLRKTGGRHYRGGDGVSALDRRVETQKAERKLIVKDFIDKSTRQYDALLKAVEALGPNLGKKVLLSDKLEALRNALARLSQSRLGALNLELALIGYYSDAAAREKKETFIAGLRVVLGVLDEIMGMEMYRGSTQYFAAMRAAIDSLLRTVDYYSDVITKKYGSGDAGDGDIDTVEGGQPEELSGLPEIARSSYDLERAINTFLYFYYVAKVRANLAQTHTELEYYGEKYNDILGDAVAARLRLLQKERDDKLANAVYNPAAAAGGAAPTPAALATAAKAKKFISDEYECKSNFYRALQALDLYMKAFTDGIVAHPDEVADIKKSLDGVEVIGRWFIEDTGDDLAAAFEMMPSYDGANRVAANANGIAAAAGAHYYEKVAASAESGGLFTPGVPQLGLSVDSADALRRQVSKVFDNFQALKNIVNAFVRIGDKFGGRELRREVFLSPTQMYKALLDYMKCSALSLGLQGANPVPLGGANVPAAGPAPDAEVYFGSVGLNPGDFAIEDKYFSFCVKSMAAKVLTVLGVFDLFERPSPVYELTPTRMIIGGDDYDAVPEAIPEAAELYFRLPRLVEFYKDLFAFDTAGAAVQISMLPEMEGVFSGLIRLIFQRVEGGAASSGDYSDLEIRALVREINGIYDHFRGAGKGSAISEALTSFVMEINRRYGLVKKEEWETLQKLFSESRRAGEYGALNQTNYSILPGEEEYQADRRAPSDRYLGPGAAAAAQLPGGKYQIDGAGWAQWQMLKAFREKLDGLFRTVNPDEFTTYSFSTIIRQGEAEMRRAEGVAGKIAVAARIIQGSGSLASIDVGKAFMFHETVVVGLNLLNALYTLLDGFRQRVADTDVLRIRKLISDWVAGLGGNAAAVVDKAAMDALLAPAAGFSATAQEIIHDGATPIAGRAGGSAAAGDVYALLYAQAQAAARAGPVSDELRATLSTYAVNNVRAMSYLLAIVSGITTTFQGLVTARFPGTATGQLHLDFSNMRGLIQGLMADVRFYLDMFRPHVAKAVVQKYEDRSNPGSLYWLEEKLLDGLVRGRPDDASQPADQRTKTLEWISRTVNTSYVALVGFSPYTLANVTAANLAAGARLVSAAAAAPGTAANYEQYGRLFAALTYYDAVADENSGLSGLASVPLLTAGGLNALVSTQRPQPPPGAARNLPLAGAGGAASSRANLWSGTLEGLTANRSLLIAFNQLVAQYLQVFYDATSGKIYRNLIDGFANGAFSRAVMTPGNSLPDMYAGGAVGAAPFGQRGDPLPGGILCESLALIFQRLATDLSPATQTSDHLVATLSEIPLYMRESFRANLPGFIKLLELVQREGEFYKQLMSQTAIQVGRPYGPQSLAGAGAKIILAGGAVTDAAPGAMAAGAMSASVDLLANSPPGSDGMKLVLSRVIDGVAAGCYSISSAAAEVLRELADEPLYLQTQENSIQEYKARYGKIPLMPLSSALTFLKNLSAAPGGDTRLMPVHSAGDETFKFAYGTRKLLGRPTARFTLADAPGVRANIESYNGSASGREKIDPGRFDQFLANAAAALRFVVDTRNFRGILTGRRGAPLRADLLQATGGGNVAIGNIASGAQANTVFQARDDTSPQMAISLTESSYQEQELKRLSDVVGGSGPVSLGQDRRKEWIYNIIDMNIIPVNVHALMRGIPLAPLYNYGYTFDQMVCLLFGQSVETLDGMNMDVAAAGGIRNTRQAFLKLVLDPYAEVSAATYGGVPQLEAGASNGLIQRIFRGDGSLLMGRPKFLSDQVFNKALFGSMIPTPYDFDETGPPGAGRMAAGRRPGTVAAAMPKGGPPVGPLAAGAPAQWGGPGGLFTAAAVPAGSLPYGDRRAYPLLTYVGTPEGEDASSALKQVQLGNNSAGKLEYLAQIGKLRFDTRLVRNLFFVANVQRLMRLKLNQELTQYRNVLVAGHSVVNPGVTEYGAIPASNLSDGALAQFGPGNETAAFRRYDNETRLVQ